MGREANKSHGYPGEAEQSSTQESVKLSREGRADSTTQSREDTIRRAAYESYLRRNGGPGDETSDRLDAEAQVHQGSGA